MTKAADRILESLNAVERERSARALNDDWRERVQAIKAYQQQRFIRTYEDLLGNPRYAPAARFFLDELYGPRDFSDRDAQFARVVPALLRLFPREIIETVSALAALHALSESLDSEMGRRIASPRSLGRDAYVTAWQACGRVDARQRQIALTLDVGTALDVHTRRPMLRSSLRMMRGPAKAAGLNELQLFLEAGFDAFAVMRGADDFLAIIAERERALVAALFGAGEHCRATQSPLALLP